jgi:hypothetical protein
MIREWIGRFYAFIFESKIGSKFLHIDTSGEKVSWNEKGLSRFFFWNTLLYFALFFSLIAFISQSFTWRFALSAIVISLYTKEKFVPFLAELLRDHDKVDFEPRTPIKERRHYKILRDIVNGDGIFESLERRS